MQKELEIYDFKNINPDDKLNSLTENKNKSVLVAIELPNHRRWQTLESLEELKALAESAGLEVIKHFINKRDEMSSVFFIGKGTIESLKDYCYVNSINYILFDDDLTPAQTKNIAKEMGNSVSIIDRTGIILDIFGKRAKTKEGKLQVELAKLEYMLPRLTRQWQHLIHQEGGTGGTVGVRGPGEKQLEMDRRQIRDRINSIKKELEVVKNYRSTQRKQRQRNNIPVLSLIGYTNAGKSTLFNKITNSNVIVEDKLFATLDPTTRKFKLPNNQDAILIDTVGFIKKLPHQLIDAFKATLEELKQSDILIHVLDVSDDKSEDRKKVVIDLLTELQVDNKTIVTTLNKIDIMTNSAAISTMEKENYPCIAVSAKTGEGIKQFFDTITKQLANYRVHAKLFFPVNQQSLISRLYESGKVITRKDKAAGVYIEAEYDKSLEGVLSSYHKE